MEESIKEARQNEQLRARQVREKESGKCYHHTLACS
jgi:hypothetical protein